MSNHYVVHLKLHNIVCKLYFSKKETKNSNKVRSGEKEIIRINVEMKEINEIESKENQLSWVFVK